MGCFTLERLESAGWVAWDGMKLPPEKREAPPSIWLENIFLVAIEMENPNPRTCWKLGENVGVKLWGAREIYASMAPAESIPAKRIFLFNKLQAVQASLRLGGLVDMLT